jgi:cytochrome c553
MNDIPPSTLPRRLPVAVWLIPALGIVLPVVAVCYNLLLDRSGAPVQRAASTQTPTQATSPSASEPSAASATQAERRATDFVPTPAAWSALLAAAAPADPARGQRLVTQGNGASMPACASCHAPNSPAPQAFHVLAGMPVEYLVKQVLDFRQGSRQSPIMQPIAKDMTDADIVAAARYYASQPRPQTPTLATDGAGAKLHIAGDNARALPACTNCHGVSGEGGGPVLPPLTGQPKGYVAAQLNAFRTHTRANDDGGVMQAFAERLTDADIAGLDALYTGAPAPASASASSPAAAQTAGK